jgi:putative membrane protein
MKRTTLAMVGCIAALTAACNMRDDRDASVTTRTDTAVIDPRATNDGAVGTSGTADQSSATAGQATGTQTGDVNQFVQQAAIGGMAEVQLGQLTEKRAASAKVKQFARMMVRDHTKSNNELKQAAAAQNVTLPTQLDDKHREVMQRLQQLNGAEFDREYMRVMVDGHMEMRDLLDDRAERPGGASAGNRSTGAAGTSGTTRSGTTATAGSANRVDQWASKTLPAVEHHLMEAQELSASVQNGGPATPRQAPR